MNSQFDIPEIPSELIDQSKRVQSKVWRREDLDLRDPALMVIWDWSEDDPAVPEPERKYIGATVSERIRDPEVDLRNQLVTIRRDIEHMRISQDLGIANALFPALHLVHFGTGPLATAFGATWVVRETDQPFFAPAVRTPAEALRLRKPDLRRDGILPLIYERIAYFRDATQGKIPICVCDTAGPWSIATQIWHYQDILQAIIEAPEAVHYLLDLVTECMIEFTHMQITRMAKWSETTNTLPHLWHPCGTIIGDDTMVTVSPKIWEEFFLPYNNRISREFGGAGYHCCLGYDRYFPSLIKTDNFLGFDASPKYNDIEKIEAALSGRGVWFRYLGGIPKSENGTTGRRDDLPLIRRLRGKVGMYLGVHGTNRQDAIGRSKRLLDAL